MNIVVKDGGGMKDHYEKGCGNGDRSLDIEVDGE